MSDGWWRFWIDNWHHNTQNSTLNIHYTQVGVSFRSHHIFCNPISNNAVTLTSVIETVWVRIYSWDNGILFWKWQYSTPLQLCEGWSTFNRNRFCHNMGHMNQIMRKPVYVLGLIKITIACASSDQISNIVGPQSWKFSSK